MNKIQDKRHRIIISFSILLALLFSSYILNNEWFLDRGWMSAPLILFPINYFIKRFAGLNCSIGVIEVKATDSFLRKLTADITAGIVLFGGAYHLMIPRY